MPARILVSSVGRVLGRALSSLFVLSGECQTAFFVEAGFPQQVFQLLAELADVGAGAAQFDGHVDVLAVTVFPAELVASAEVGEQLWAVLLQETLDALDSVPVFDIFYLLAGCVIGLLQDGEVTEHLRIVTVLFFAGVPGEIDENFPVGALGVVALLGLLQELAAVGHVGHEGHICACVVVHYSLTEHHECVGLDLLSTFGMTHFCKGEAPFISFTSKTSGSLSISFLRYEMKYILFFYKGTNKSKKNGPKAIFFTFQSQDSIPEHFLCE